MGICAGNAPYARASSVEIPISGHPIALAAPYGNEIEFSPVDLIQSKEIINHGKKPSRMAGPDYYVDLRLEDPVHNECDGADIG